MSSRRAIVLATLVALSAVVLPAAPAMAQPSNDNFADARTVTGVPYSDTVEVTGSTVETGEPVSACRETGAPSGTVWYAFTPADTTTVNITPTANFELILAVYTGSSLTTLAEMACQFSQSPLYLSVTGGQTYYLQIGTFFDRTGTLQLDIAFPPPPPASDDFADATSVTGVPYSDTVEVTGSTLETGEPVSACADAVAPTGTVWYAFTPAETSTAKIAVTGAHYVLAVYTGISLTTLTEVTCQQSELRPLSLPVTAGQTYYLQIGTFHHQTGTLQLDIMPPPPPPATDDFADARTVTGVPYSDIVEVTGSTVETGEPVSACRGMAGPSGTVWYTFTPTGTTNVNITRTADFQSFLAVYTGSSLSSLTETARSSSPTLSVRLIARKTYYLQIGTFFDQTGTLQLDITRVRGRPSAG